MNKNALYRERVHRLAWTRPLRYDFRAFCKETTRIVSQEIMFVTNRPSRASNTCLKLGNLTRLPLGRAEMFAQTHAGAKKKNKKKIRSHTCIKIHLHSENAYWLTRRHNKKMNNYFVTNWFLSKLKFTYNQDRSLIKTKQIINDKYLLILWNCFLLKLNLFIFFSAKRRDMLTSMSSLDCDKLSRKTRREKEKKQKKKTKKCWIIKKMEKEKERKKREDRKENIKKKDK